MIFESSDSFTLFPKDVGQNYFGFVWLDMWRIFLQLHFVRMFHFALAQAISCQNVNEFGNSLSHDSNGPESRLAYSLFFSWYSSELAPHR